MERLNGEERGVEKGGGELAGSLMVELREAPSSVECSRCTPPCQRKKQEQRHQSHMLPAHSYSVRRLQQQAHHPGPRFAGGGSKHLSPQSPRPCSAEQHPSPQVRRL